MKMDATLLFSRFPEFGQLPPCPFRFNIAGRDDRYQRGHAAESLHQGLAKSIVAGKLWIAPDLRWFAEELSDADFEGSMQVCDPSLASFNQLHIIHVGVANESIPLKAHDFPRGGS